MILISTTVTRQPNCNATCVRHYRIKEFEDAVDYYTMALHYCPEDDEHKKDRAVYLANRAQGHLQLKEVSVTTEFEDLEGFRGTFRTRGNRVGPTTASLCDVRKGCGLTAR